ncbi:glycosylated lysosomal membrane protein-like [Festucalex cinctus]
MAAARLQWDAWLLLVFSTVCSLAAASFTRNLSVELNPGSPAPPPGGDLLHVRALGDADTLHFLFCSQGAPALLLVRTNVTSSRVWVDWPRFLSGNSSGSLRVEPASSVVSSTALIFSRLLEYDDVNNTAEMPFDLFPPYRLRDDVRWSAMELSGASARLCGGVAGGSVCLHLSVFGREGRDETWPRLLHTANSSQVSVRLDGLRPRSARSRFVLELRAAVGGAYPLDAVRVRRSIDDEFTPSIFKVSEWTSAVGDGGGGGFVQWKQVAYRRPAPTLEDASPCRHSDPRRPAGRALAEAGGLALAFLGGGGDAGEDGVLAINVSFGVAGEAFYNHTRFLTWTTLVGVGIPPADAFSPLVAAIMAAGLGAPLAILLMGGVYVCLRKRRAAASAGNYQPIN